MRKKIFIIQFLFMCLCVSSFAQSDTLVGYYYADGAKQYWQTDSTSINIIVGNQQNYDSIAARLERIVNRNGGIVIYDNEDNNIIVNSPTKLTLNSISNLINNVVRFRDDIVFSSYAKTLNGGRLWPTNEVYVKLKDSLYYYSHVVPIVSNYTNVTSFYEGDKEWRLVCKKENDVVRLANHLYDTNYVVYSTPDFYDENISLCDMNDTYYGSQWALNNSGFGGFDRDIKAEKAWAFLEKILGERGSYMKIAVIDDGVEEHEDLYLSTGVSKVLTGYTASGNGTGRPRPNNKHGECCAGIIATSHNNIGIAGVAPNARIVPIRIFKNAFYVHDNDTIHHTFSHAKIARSIKKSWDVFECPILSNSWGGKKKNDKIKNAFNYVMNNGRNGMGCIVFAASGNDSIDTIRYPAAYNGIMAIGAMNRHGQRCRFSNYGTNLDVIAPGKGIYTIDRENDNAAGYVANSKYFSNFDGTSAACPHVSAIAALMLSVNPGLTKQQVIDILEQTAQKDLYYNYFGGSNYINTSNGTWNEEVGYGLVDAHMAVVKSFLNSCSMVINGSTTINECSQYTYAFSMPKSEAFTYSWQVSNNLSIISENDSIVTVVPCGNGNATITADLYSEGRYVHSMSKNIQINGNSLSGYYSICSAPMLINNNETWSNSNLLLGNTVTINDGGLLTITGTIHCLSNASIIVKPGGKLVIDGGTLTSACSGEMWQGIQVWGDINAPQTATNGVYQQGYVELKNGVTIENAICAIDLWKPNDYTKTGGIVVATDANFINNARAVRALHYVYTNNNNTEANYNAHFTRCNFEVNEDYLGTETFYKHVGLTNVKGVEFLGCTFSVDRTASNIDTYCLGIGADDAGFTVSSLCNAPNTVPCPNGSLSMCTFTGFYNAIYAIHTNTQRPFQVLDCEFNNNINGVYAINTGFVQILGNTFSVPSDDICTYGVYLESMSSFYVGENDFNGAGRGCENCGVAVKTSPCDNILTQNNFSNLAYGTKSIGKNYNIISNSPLSFSTLSYLCNNNYSNGYADFHAVSDGNSIGCVYSMGTPSFSAGNTFSSNPTDNQISNQTAEAFIYYYDTIYACRRPSHTYGVDTVKSYNADNCGIGGGGIVNKSPNSEYEDAENNCNRIKAALDAETDPDNIEALETEYSYAEHKRRIIIDNTVREILMDSVSNINEVRQWLDRANTPSADRAICATYLSQGDYETAINKAVAMINDYQMQDDALIEQTEYIEILHIQQKVESDGRVIQQLNDDELRQVHRLYDYGTGVAKSMAKALLQMNGNFFECDCNNELITRENVETKANAISKTMESETYFFSVSPVPAKDYVIINYNLPTDHATLFITNNLGINIKTVKIDGTQGKKVVSLSDLTAGVYSCTINCEGFAESQKIVLTK